MVSDGPSDQQKILFNYYSTTFFFTKLETLIDCQSFMIYNKERKKKRLEKKPVVVHSFHQKVMGGGLFSLRLDEHGILPQFCSHPTGSLRLVCYNFIAALECGQNAIYPLHLQWNFFPDGFELMEYMQQSADVFTIRQHIKQ